MELLVFGGVKTPDAGSRPPAVGLQCERRSDQFPHLFSCEGRFPGLVSNQWSGNADEFATTEESFLVEGFPG
jgi:hypothetical protein